MLKALALLVLFSTVTTAHVTAHVTAFNNVALTALRIHLANRSADYAMHIDDMYTEFKQPSSHRHAFIQSSSKQARRRARRLQRMHLKELADYYNECNADII